jgi:chemotaxis signal transduction protein
VVDKVTEVFGTLESSAREVPQIASGEQARGIKAVYSHRGRLVFVLDVDRLTAIADELAPALEAGVQSGALSSG